MNVKLATWCMRLWLAGFVGMWIARAFFDCGPGQLGFEVCALLWAIGGLTYGLLAGLFVLASTEAEA
jgi:hypothetical protein